jgi:hypothetical protein
MGKPELSSSEHFLPPKTLAERLKAQANGQAEIEPHLHGERFAPDLPSAANEPELEALPEPMEDVSAARVTEPTAERSLRSSGLIMMAFALVALVPVIAFAALYSRGALSITSLTAVVGDDGAKPAAQPTEDSAKTSPAEVQQAAQPEVQKAAVAPAPETILPKRAVELPSVAISVPNAIAAEAGKETIFAIALDSDDSLPPRSIVTIRGLPEGTSFSAGRPFRRDGMEPAAR